MDVRKQHVRPFRDIVDDGLYPNDTPRPDDHECDRRSQAIAEVLGRLPDKPYQRLKKLKKSRKSFDWFVPHLSVRGLVYPFLPNMRPRNLRLLRLGSSTLSPHVRIVYLSPVLEFSFFDDLVYVVVHELAHVYLDHALHSATHEAAKAEREVNRAVRSWGFEREADRIEGLNE